MIKLYGVAMYTCTAKILACLQEHGVEFELVPVNVQNGEHKQLAFLAKNASYAQCDLLLFNLMKYCPMPSADGGDQVEQEVRLPSIQDIRFSNRSLTNLSVLALEDWNLRSSLQIFSAIMMNL
ncbi:hypothetical protein V6N11_059723 [Hibiscus sabdariffa]|uniref:GST N-terminal domain-containing protein n=2 Tax=Hibiscus sabdariffa TaxID=183260 RepID=A0ABR2A1Q8_9ROSI